MTNPTPSRRSAEEGSLTKPLPVRTVVYALTVVVLLGLCVVALSWDWFLVQVMLLVHMNDFGKFYYSAQAFLAGTDMYAPNAATTLGYGAAPVQYLNMNPPHFHALILPFALLRPAAAVTAWMVLGFFAFVLSMLLISRELQLRITTRGVVAVTLASLVIAPSQTFFLTGQLSFLLMLPITLAWLDARHGRWTRAGAWLGACMSVKPFLLIFVPYLLLTRRTRAVLVALRTVALTFVLGVLVFGLANYRAWFRAMVVSSDWAWASMNASAFAIFLRVFGRNPYFVTVWDRPALIVGWIVVAGVIGIATLFVVYKDNGTLAVDHAFGLLLVASQLISPLGWVYYLWLPAGPIAMLALYGAERRDGHSVAIWVVGAVAICASLFPPTAVFLFQPHRWATAFIASAYFWAMLSVWGWLMLHSARLPAEKLDA